MRHNCRAIVRITAFFCREEHQSGAAVLLVGPCWTPEVKTPLNSISNLSSIHPWKAFFLQSLASSNFTQDSCTFFHFRQCENGCVFFWYRTGSSPWHDVSRWFVCLLSLSDFRLSNPCASSSSSSSFSLSSSSSSISTTSSVNSNVISLVTTLNVDWMFFYSIIYIN